MKLKKIIYLETVLRWMAICILKKYRPKVVGITGSVGKTSAKEAIYLVLKKDFQVRANRESYNNEIGIPLTIIGSKSGGKCFLKWLVVFLKWLGYLILPLKYPKILILEMAIDRPGDMRYLTSFIPIEASVLTDISISHLEFFKNVQQIAKEKIILAKVATGLVVFNADNQLVKKEIEKINSQTVGYGMGAEAKIRATDIQFNYQQDQLQGLSFKLNYQGKTIPLRLPNIIAEHQIYAVLAGVAVANYFKINLVKAVDSLVEFETPVHRMSLIKGINNSLIIDDTFNASPTSVLAALETMQKMKATKKIVVLGDMLELGRESKNGHLQVIKKIFANKIDVLITVGEKMNEAVKIALLAENFLGKIKHFESAVEASKEIDKLANENNLILVKGSKAMKMKIIVDALTDH